MKLDGNLALLVGNIAGSLTCFAYENPEVPTKVEILYDADGNYTNHIRVERPSGTYLISVNKEGNVWDGDSLPGG